MCIRSNSVIILLAACLLLSSCKSNPYQNDTRLFGDYLQTALGLSIPDDSMNYVVISESACDGCVGKTVTKLSANHNTLFIINQKTYNKYLEPKQVAKSLYVIDTTNRINRLKYHNYSVGVVQTADKEIYNIVYVDYLKADSILQTIK